MGLENEQQEPTCTQPSVQLHRCVSVLPNDYNILENRPTLDGVTIEGDLTKEKLGVLSANAEDFVDVELEAAKEGGGYLIVVMPGQAPKKILLSDLKSGGGGEVGSGGFQTVEDMDAPAAVGSFLFVKKKG